MNEKNEREFDWKHLKRGRGRGLNLVRERLPWRKVSEGSKKLLFTY